VHVLPHALDYALVEQAAQAARLRTFLDGSSLGDASVAEEDVLLAVRLARMTLADVRQQVSTVCKRREMTRSELSDFVLWGYESDAAPEESDRRRMRLVQQVQQWQIDTLQRTREHNSRLTTRTLQSFRIAVEESSEFSERQRQLLDDLRAENTTVFEFVCAVLLKLHSAIMAPGSIDLFLNLVMYGAWTPANVNADVHSERFWPQQVKETFGEFALRTDDAEAAQRVALVLGEAYEMVMELKALNDLLLAHYVMPDEEKCTQREAMNNDALSVLLTRWPNRKASVTRDTKTERERFVYAVSWNDILEL
jgi:hypothetical protein